jgi:cytochrome c556
MRAGSTIAIVVAAFAAAATGAATQTPEQPAQRGPASSALNYVPGVGDMMNLLVQPRHTKLGLAFRERNWELAAYAYKELEQAFSTVAKVQPKWRNLTVAEMIDSMTGEPMRDLEAAIGAHDGKKFTAAYDSLTDGCNSCHTAVNHGFIVIKTPEASAFPNQEFKGH